MSHASEYAKSIAWAFSRIRRPVTLEEGLAYHDAHKDDSVDEDCVELNEQSRREAELAARMQRKE